ncbi:MAG: hypothetical protein E6P95_03100 [Candidatus Moraniibacteriota bacterium]|nr:MAG: hypothetical protein E6P95_03100 [Candidatus Moranbacteria bacterium]
MKYKIVIALFFLLFSVGISTKAYAQENDGRLDITVSPPVIELTAKPGQKVQEKFRVRNNLDTSIDLQLSVRRLTSDPTDGNPVPENTATGEELKWVSFDKSEFTARPSEWQDITFTIDIPDSAAYGYYYVFRITPKENSEINSSGTKIKGEVLIVTLLNVKKDGATSKTELVSFKAKNGISEYLPVDFAVKLANKGNVHVKPRGNIFITRGGGKEITILEVNPGVGSILPGGTREFDSSWTDGFIVKESVMEDGEVKLDSRGNPVTHLQINWNKLTSLRIGPYEAKLLMVYDDGVKDVTIEGVTTFWVIPYTAIGVAIIAIVVLFVFIKFILGMYIRGQIAKSRK